MVLLGHHSARSMMIIKSLSSGSCHMEEYAGHGKHVAGHGKESGTALTSVSLLLFVFSPYTQRLYRTVDSKPPLQSFVRSSNGSPMENLWTSSSTLPMLSLMM